MKLLYLLLNISKWLMIASFVFFSISFVEATTNANIFIPNTFLASSGLIDSKKDITLEDSMNQPYLENANENSKFNEFTEETIDPNGFYIRIDKINLFKAIVKDVDPRYKDVYVKSWEKGVSHGKFTAYPDQIGITYLFAHAMSNKNNAAKENAWFSYMDEVIIGDEVIIYYEGIKYIYEVSEIHEVTPDSTGFYTGVSPVKKVRMQFCGPPTGSLAMRTLVDALLIEEVEL